MTYTVHQTFKVDEETPYPLDPLYYETTIWRDIGDGVSFRPTKHWGRGTWGAEGCTKVWGDSSGCLRGNGNYIAPPRLVESRHYRNGVYSVWAVFSYPDGWGCTDHYFWEIYSETEELPGGFEEEVNERFSGEGAEGRMERRIIELIGNAANGGEE